MAAAGLAATPVVAATVGWSASASAAQASVDLGTASSFAVLANQSVTNTGPTVLTGNLGLYPNTATSVTGFPPGTVHGTQYAADGVAQQAQTDAFGPAGSGSAGAYNTAATTTPTNNTNYAVLSNATTLGPGVYNATSSMTVDGTLTLQGDPSSVFIFQAGSSLLVGQTNPTSVVLAAAPGASGPVQACHVFWQVTSSATLGTTAGNPTAFVGTILALQSATLNSGVSVVGRVLAGQASVSLDNNDISVAPCNTSTTTAPSATLVSLGNSLDDVATVTGNTTDGTPTGSVQTYECGPASTSCSSTSGNPVGPAEPLTGGVATSPSFTPGAVGTYCFASVYTPSTASPYGTSSEVGNTTNGECFVVTAAAGTPPPVTPPPTITTTAPSTALVSLGHAVNDVATVTGNATDGTPTGTVQTYECGPGSILCSSTSGTALGAPETLSGGVATSPSFTPGAVGTYCFASVYTPSAGSPYLASSEAGSLTNGECFKVMAAAGTPSPTATPSPASTTSPTRTTSPTGTTVALPGGGTFGGGMSSGGSGGTLASTGLDTLRLLMVAFALQMAGMLLLVFAHGYRRRSRADPCRERDGRSRAKGCDTPVRGVGAGADGPVGGYGTSTTFPCGAPDRLSSAAERHSASGNLFATGMVNWPAAASIA